MVPGNSLGEVVKATGRRWTAASDSCADRVGGTHRAVWRGVDSGPRRRPGGTWLGGFRRHSVRFAAMAGRFGGYLGSWSDSRSTSHGKPCRREGYKGRMNRSSFSTWIRVQVSNVDKVLTRSDHPESLGSFKTRTGRIGKGRWGGMALKPSMFRDGEGMGGGKKAKGMTALG